ncbi:flagellar hook-associated protein [Pseudescherichia vulneris]|uniref:flagellar hook-associated protein n=1 Tax=Pseudescherichia vulneris TaxID=566 RepID=UPI003016F33D
MQVGLQTTTRSSSNALVGTQISDSARVASPPKRAEREEYPASPLIVLRPQRYSVQLNDQLTVLQQADSYLSQLEKSLLNQRHANSAGGQRGESSAALVDLLANRAQRSAGRVDRQLLPVLQGEAQVTFHAPELAALLANNGEPVSLMFSAEVGHGRRLAAVSLDNPAEALNPVMQIKNALQRTGVMPRYSEGRWTFTTDEANWPQLQRSFTLADAKGDHVRRPAFHASPSPCDALGTALESGQRDGLQSMVQSVLHQVGEQRQQLASAQEKARQRMDVMARFPEAQSAEHASAALGQTLAWACHHYDTLAQAVNGQANLSGLTVQNLLS